MSGADHEFGNVSTDLKLSLVGGYLSAFTTALRRQFSELLYIDAFAGSGVRTIKHKGIPADLLPGMDERIEHRKGSAQIAIDTRPMFDRLIFMETKRKFCRALEELKSRHPDRRIEVVRANANEAIRTGIASERWIGKRAVMFLDPYGMGVDWTTLEAIRSTEAIDVWYLVSLAGLFRQATINPSDLTDDKRSAITRMLGTNEWEDAWSRRERRTDMLGDADESWQRTANVATIEAFVQERLTGLFPKVLPPRRLKNARGVPMFSLFLAISNPEPKAIGLATKIGNYILKPQLRPASRRRSDP